LSFMARKRAQSVRDVFVEDFVLTFMKFRGYLISNRPVFKFHIWDLPKVSGVACDHSIAVCDGACGYSAIGAAQTPDRRRHGFVDEVGLITEWQNLKAWNVLENLCEQRITSCSFAPPLITANQLKRSLNHLFGRDDTDPQALRGSRKDPAYQNGLLISMMEE